MRSRRREPGDRNGDDTIVGVALRSDFGRVEGGARRRRSRTAPIRLKRSCQRGCRLACKRSRQRGQRSNEVRSCATFSASVIRNTTSAARSWKENLVSK